MKKFILIAGPCVIENEKMVMQIAKTMKRITDKLQIDYYFKASFDKANRTSIDSFRGPGIKKGLAILNRVKNQVGVKIVTDIHEPWQAELAAKVCNIIQIPAFLCRQTDLLVAAAKTNKIINVKKAQFLSGNDMKNVVKKIEDAGNKKIMLCERGSTFGYNSLVVDFTQIIEMKKFGYPVIFDATHSVQKPGSCGKSTGGNSSYIVPLASAAVAIGVDGIFAEVHPCPKKALSDGQNSIKLSEVENVLVKLLKIHRLNN